METVAKWLTIACGVFCMLWLLLAIWGLAPGKPNQQEAMFYWSFMAGVLSGFAWGIKSMDN